VKPTRIIIILAVGLAVGGVCYLQIRRDEASVQSRSTCINNLDWIAGAKDVLARERGLKAGAVVSEETVAAYIVHGWPNCPAGGKYTVNPIGQSPTCSVVGHSLAR
jgi:hypothetical protein